jgi:hypothetical protein
MWRGNLNPVIPAKAGIDNHNISGKREQRWVLVRSVWHDVLRIDPPICTDEANIPIVDVE